MNFREHYASLIERAKGRTLTEDFDLNHSLHRCLGGDSKENLIKLTPEGHFVAHRLLDNIYPNKKTVETRQATNTGQWQSKESYAKMWKTRRKNKLSNCGVK